MITNEELKQYFLAIDDIDKVQVEGDGKHYQLTLVSDVFVGKTKVALQQWVYAKMKDYIIYI